MRKAFTVIEVMIVVSLIGIIAAIAIPAIMDNRVVSSPGEPTIEYRDIVGKTFNWNGNKTLIVDYNGDWKYVVVIMPKDGNAVSAAADRKVIMAAYREELKKATPAEKVEQ
jgi:prepilin-type N-terminal cleavage/methylation domain-containing protein